MLALHATPASSLDSATRFAAIEWVPIAEAQVADGPSTLGLQVPCPEPSQMNAMPVADFVI